MPVKVSAAPPVSMPPKLSAESRRVSSNSNRSRYQPRDAAVTEKSDNSDLIDFIRQGPPSSGNNHRIPRHVAPFRNTMDSDQMAGANGGLAVDATIPEIRHSQASTNITDNSMPSMQSSVNSSSALLKKTGGNAPNKMFDDDDMMPKRKQRRVRDPYAIDFSDEEDDDLFTATPQPPVKKEESLAEFLRNYEPPPAAPSPAPVAQKQPKKKMSAPSLMARFRNTYRGDSSSSSPVPRAQVPTDASSLRGASSSRTHVPLQVAMPSGYNKYGPVEPAVQRPRMQSGGGSSGRVPMKRFEPREAVSETSHTNDLAAFLRDSEPPPGSAGPRAHSPIQEESNGISRMFGRRKKMGIA